MLKRKAIPVLTAAALFFAIPGAQKAHACPDINGLLTHCANFQVIAGIVNFITANVHKPPGARGYGGFGRTPEVLLNQLALFNLLYFSALMNAIITPLPTSNANSSDNTLDLSGDDIEPGTFDLEPGTFGRPLCGAAGDCSEGPVGELFGGGPNSGYSCDASAGPACGADFYNPSLDDDLRNYTQNTVSQSTVSSYLDALRYQQEFGGVRVASSDAPPFDFNTFVNRHRFGNNVTTGAMDPFGGGSDDSYINPRTGETISFDPANPPPEVEKAQALISAYVNEQINYPFFDDDWENRPISDFDPNQGNRGGVRTLGQSVIGELSDNPLFPGATTGGTAGSGHSTTASGEKSAAGADERSGSRAEYEAFQRARGYLGQSFSDGLQHYFVTVNYGGDSGASSRIQSSGGASGQGGGLPGIRGNLLLEDTQREFSTPKVMADILTKQNAARAQAIRQKSVLIDEKTMFFSGSTHNVEIVQDADGKMMALGTGENAGHVFGEVRKGTTKFGGYRREGPWQAPGVFAGASPTATQTSGTGTERSGNDSLDCDNCQVIIPPSKFESGRFYVQVNANIAQSDQVDMAGAFTDGFESGNTAEWSVVISP